MFVYKVVARSSFDVPFVYNSHMLSSGPDLAMLETQANAQPENASAQAAYLHVSSNKLLICYVAMMSHFYSSENNTKLCDSVFAKYIKYEYTISQLSSILESII